MKSTHASIGIVPWLASGFLAALLGALPLLADEAKPITIDRLSWSIESATPPEGNVLEIAGTNPGVGAGSFKVYAAFPVASMGLSPGEYSLRVEALFIERPSRVVVGFRGSGGSPSSFLNGFAGSEWQFAPVGTWDAYTCRFVINTEQPWIGEIEVEAHFYGGDNDPPMQGRFLLAGMSVTNAEGEELLATAQHPFANENPGTKPTSVKTGTDFRSSHEGSASALIVGPEAYQ